MHRIVLIFPLFAVVPLQAALDGRGNMEPFLEKHCYECHDDVTAKGGLNLLDLGNELQDDAIAAKWERVYDRVAQGEMPPEEKQQPGQSEIDAFTGPLSNALTTAHAEKKGVVLRRLNRQEYENTINDLFGINVKVVNLLPEDGRSHEFENVGESLNVSMVHMQRYLDAAGVALDDTINTRISKPESKVVRANYADSREGKTHIGKAWHQLPDGAVVFFKQRGYPSGMLRDANSQQRGLYKIRVTGYAYQSEDPITFSVRGTTFQRGADKPTFGYFSMPPGKPTTIELEAWMEARYMVQIEPEGITDQNNELRDIGLDEYKGPGLAILHVEIEGPIIDRYPTKGHDLIFEGIDRQEVMPNNPKDREKTYYKPRFEIHA